MAKESRMTIASPTGSDTKKAFSLEGRLWRERERLAGMSDEERCWRLQWKRDQQICPRVENPELRRELTNPIRRFYRFPLDRLYQVMAPRVGRENAWIARTLIGQLFLGLSALYLGHYYFKYNSNDWTRKGGWRVLTGRPHLYLGEPGFPDKYQRKHPSEYSSRGFENSPI